MPDSEQINVELRGPCPKWVVDVLDAVSSGKRISRTEQVNRVLARWARLKMHESNVVQLVTRGNPPPKEQDWRMTE